MLECSSIIWEVENLLKPGDWTVLARKFKAFYLEFELKSGLNKQTNLSLKHDYASNYHSIKSVKKYTSSRITKLVACSV